MKILFSFLVVSTLVLSADSAENYFEKSKVCVPAVASVPNMLEAGKAVQACFEEKVKAAFQSSVVVQAVNGQYNLVALENVGIFTDVGPLSQCLKSKLQALPKAVPSVYPPNCTEFLGRHPTYHYEVIREIPSYQVTVLPNPTLSDKVETELSIKAASPYESLEACESAFPAGNRDTVISQIKIHFSKAAKDKPSRAVSCWALPKKEAYLDKYQKCVCEKVLTIERNRLTINPRITFEITQKGKTTFSKTGYGDAHDSVYWLIRKPEAVAIQYYRWVKK